MSYKHHLLAAGVGLAKAFCETNSLKLPSLEVVTPASWRFSSTCAYYRPETVTICVERCAHIGHGGQAWSYPGYVIDRTPYGVVQHELGHHVDYVRSETKGAYGGDFSVKMRQAADEPKLTNYCPNDWEWFAEMFRLFVTNSDLLRAVRPRTYALLRDTGLEPVVTEPWREILKAAPERTIEMAARKAS